MRPAPPVNPTSGGVRSSKKRVVLPTLGIYKVLLGRSAYTWRRDPSGTERIFDDADQVRSFCGRARLAAEWCDPRSASHWAWDAARLVAPQGPCRSPRDPRA